MWDLVRRLGGQFRSGFSGVTGLDMGAAFAIGRGLGLSDLIMAEVLPEIETAWVTTIRKSASQGD